MLPQDNDLVGDKCIYKDLGNQIDVKFDSLIRTCYISGLRPQCF